jgi:general secretion pathway protein E
MELGVPSYLINATLLGVLASAWCARCARNASSGTKRHPRDALDAVIKPWQINGGYRPFKAVGCVDCRMTGFMGRMGLYELLVVRGLQGPGHQEPSADALKRQAVADGMRPLRLAGALRVAEGLTTLDEVLLATPPVE